MFQAAMLSGNADAIIAFVSLCGYAILPAMTWVPYEKKDHSDLAGVGIIITVAYVTNEKVDTRLALVSTPNELYKFIWTTENARYSLAWWNVTAIYPGDYFLCDLGMRTNATVLVFSDRIISPWLAGKVSSTYAMSIPRVDEWDPAFYWLYPKQVKDSVLCFLLIAKRYSWRFDSTIRDKIMRYLCFGWLQNGN
eukprot:Phypoly_transcript_08179.p1 GENE.Phypoly_transcript_08179~~Phypoly_transcript_08179.p1  ORF type:complete len:194 (+),score=12.95 Phypoly_transcript_08179:952-1533(+)